MADKQDKVIKVSERFSLVVFEDESQPSFVEKKGKPYIYYGKKNDYPQYLLYLYNNSSKHMALVNGKVNYIMGKGWSFDKNLPDQSKIKAFVDSANSDGENLFEVSEKCALDMEIFNGAYVQIEWGKNGEIASIYHVDYSTVRSNKDNSMFFVSDEWVTEKSDGTIVTNSRPKFEEFHAYNPKNTSGTQILYIKKYHPGVDTYTLPTYRGSNTWIEIDIEIGNYHLSNVKGGFFANKLINLNNGLPSEEEKQKTESMFKKKFSGVTGQRFVICYNDTPEGAATVQDLSISESDKIFDLLNKTAQQEILTGHNVVSPMLFGIKTEGQLGGNNELRTAYEIFQNTYVSKKQQWIERTINMIAAKAGITSPNPLQILPTEPVSYQFTEATLARVMTDDEIRERAGLPPRSVAPGATQQFTGSEDEKDADVFAGFGYDRTKYEVIKSSQVTFMNDDDEMEHFASTMGAITSIQEQILAILKKDPLTTQQALSDSLGESLEMINEAIYDLVYNELLEVKKEVKDGETLVRRQPINNADELIKNIEPENRSIQVLYSYEGPKDDKNRPFCKRLLELNRLYSRADIEKISTRLQYSVWTRRGGWYTIPGTNTHRPYCRHSWKSNVVVKRRS
ncbi:hypothetical protein [Chitinophaga cymbidii]|uniref:Phage portal protein n=1 Tax=Chitinophaga cymbidii TaxID=1096750 RepID=A0A512RIP0_9BACT|nr:hypothetical protein [Chitinophaga cymbidii]GEP95571.1 hypothetical protein CCY01nite_18310 [Chitinophaga cymbidii]